MKQGGEISVFLALMMSVLSVFVVMLANNVRGYVSKSESILAVDNAVRSCFAEYNRELFDRFHILLIDSSYKGTNGGIGRVAEHFKMYLEGSMTQNAVENADIEDHRMSIDDYLYDEAVRYAKKELLPDDRLTRTGDDGYYLTYILNVCGTGDIPYENAARRGEIEYLIFGLSSDDENIRWAQIDNAEEDVPYEDSLVRRLEGEDIGIIRERFGALVTEYMRNNGSPGFDLENCYYDLSFSAGIKNAYSGSCSITREYSYEPSYM